MVGRVGGILGKVGANGGQGRLGGRFAREIVQGKKGGRLTGKDEWKVGKGMVGVRWAREGLR